MVDFEQADFESCLFFISNEEFAGARIGEDILTTNYRDLTPEVVWIKRLASPIASVQYAQMVFYGWLALGCSFLALNL